MAVLGGTFLTMKDLAKRMDPNHQLAKIVESLSQKNSMFEHMPWVECNDNTRHHTTSRTGLPTPTWVRLNQGQTAQVSLTDQFTDTCGALTTRSVVDPRLARIGGDPGGVRASEDLAHIAAFSNTVEDALIYASTATNPNRIQGLSPRLNSTTGAAGNQLILNEVAAETDGSDQTSMWFIAWSPETVHGIYPKGHPTGLEMVDMGDNNLVTDAGGTNQMRAYVTEFIWTFGLVVRDSSATSRLCNIDTSVLTATGATDDTIIPGMIRAYGRIKDPNVGRGCIYHNRTVDTYLWLQAREKASHQLRPGDDAAGKPVMKFQLWDLYVSDAITNTEDELA